MENVNWLLEGVYVVTLNNDDDENEAKRVSPNPDAWNDMINAHKGAAKQVADLMRKDAEQSKRLVALEARLDELRCETTRVRYERDAFRDALDPDARRQVIQHLREGE